jgi:hypothetical protein
MIALGIRLRKDPDAALMTAVQCYLDTACFDATRRASSAGLYQNLAEEVSCASRYDAYWQEAFGLHAIDSVPRALRVLIHTMRPIAFRSTKEKIIWNGELCIRVTMSNTFTEGLGTPLQFFFAADRTEVVRIGGICEFCRGLSQAHEEHRKLRTQAR